MLKHILTTTENPMTVVTLRRISSSFPPPLQTSLRDLLRPQPLSRSRPAEVEDTQTVDFIAGETSEPVLEVKKPRRKLTTREPKAESAATDKKTVTRRKKKEEGATDG
jgi:hypothetical protein